MSTAPPSASPATVASPKAYTAPPASTIQYPPTMSSAAAIVPDAGSWAGALAGASVMAAVAQMSNR